MIEEDLTMKKISTLLLVAAMIVMTVFSASAAGLSDQENRVLEALRADIPTASATLNIPAQFITQAENFLLSDDSMTEEDANNIIANIDKAKELVKDQPITKFSEVSSSIRNQVLDLAADSAKIVGAELSVSGSSISITKDGKIIFETNFSNNNNPIKQTDADMTGTIVVGALLLCGLAFTVIASRKFAVQK